MHQLENSSKYVACPGQEGPAQAIGGHSALADLPAKQTTALPFRAAAKQLSLSARAARVSVHSGEFARTDFTKTGFAAGGTRARRHLCSMGPMLGNPLVRLS
jgi:hypothetical protein